MRSPRPARRPFLSLILPATMTVAALSATSIAAHAQTAAHIHEVEKNLGGWVKIEDSAGWNVLDRMKYYHINGLSIAVIHNYRIEWAKAYGWADTAKKIPATTQTRFQAASVGKSIHAAATMRLIQQGRLDPNADINLYLRRWKFPYDSVSGGKKITTTELLSHMAGLSVPGFDGYCPDNLMPTTIQTLDGIAPANNPPVRSVAVPGTQFQYSGGGYTISGLIDEQITGERYAEFIRRTIFKPLGMTRSIYQSQLSPQEDGSLATAYRWDGKPIGCRYHVYPEEACGAGLWSTPTDLAKFLVELQLILNAKNGRTLSGKGDQILSQSSVKHLFKPQTNAANALGFFVGLKGPRYYFHHDGLNEGFVSDYYASLSDGDGVVIMANTDLALYSDITEELINSVATVYHWPQFYTPVLKKEIRPSTSVLNDYVGKYRFREGLDQFVTIYWENGRLWFRDSSSPIPWLMHFTTDKDCFFYEVFQNDHEFTRDAAGNVDGFIIHAADGSFKVTKIK